MADELAELAEFLSHEKPELRLNAAQIVNSVAASDDGPQQLVKASSQIIPPLLRLLGGREEEARAAGSALVNLSTDPRHCDEMHTAGVIGRVMENLKEKDCACKESLAMLLSNVTLSEKGSAKLLQLGEEGVEGLYLHYLVGFLTAPSASSSSSELRHLASALPHVCRLPEGRRLLLGKGTGYLPQLIPLLRSKVVEQRVAMANMLKNCAMDKQDGVAMLLAEGGSLLIPEMLHPVSGRQPRELSTEVRQAMAEAVQLMAAHEDGFDRLWAAGAADLLREGYIDEEAPGVCHAMESIAEIFMTHNSFDGQRGESEEIVGSFEII
mmetsp:Transcript_16450/g.22739  ORF Transcript_16450/g.22739 Transcript_16450/m.22739 type:complete len:324 (+) Transcript_16450:44-1015(+)|eukprot:CAMPEP_0196578126 /NCGR_PEP_ID=MMETSP1081-20130531/7091_1 /TAXON_ID=36882 /ORGANISM="Pyramimonas amylifera, Strain CCMP720" /LENGTH=323 /DNA_ID=CAMNT_0041897249 /DNA_START=36 /DNA_END=1007 /DNA_ORIENTATION=+